MYYEIQENMKITFVKIAKGIQKCPLQVLRILVHVVEGKNPVKKTERSVLRKEEAQSMTKSNLFTRLDSIIYPHQQFN